MDPLDLNVLLRMVVAMALSGVLGWEREAKGKAAGMRTHMLVGMGAALFMAVGEISVRHFQHNGAEARFDPIRVLQAVVTGISFIGAGTIFVARSRDHIKGLTTAASIWATTGVGMLAGLQRYLLAAGATVLFFIVLRLMVPVEARISPENPEGEKVGDAAHTEKLLKTTGSRPR